MVVARSYQILLPKNDFWPFSHWNSHWSPKNLRTAEGMVVERKQKLFRNQWTNWNNLKAYRSWTFIKTRITVVGNSLALEPQLSRYCSGWLNISFCSEIREQLIQYRVQCTLYTVANTYLYRVNTCTYLYRVLNNERLRSRSDTPDPEEMPYVVQIDV